MPRNRIAGIILAAGAGRRFGADKLVAELGGETLLERACSAMLGAGLDPVLAVVQAETDRQLPGQVSPVENAQWRCGISTSVRAGLAALTNVPNVGAAIVAPADQPWIGAEIHRRLMDAFHDSGRGLVVAAFDGKVRNPVLLARDQWPLAQQITGDVGLSSVVRSLAPLIVECADIGSADDIDFPADLEGRQH